MITNSPERNAIIKLANLVSDVVGRKGENDVRAILSECGIRDILDTEWLREPEPTSLELFALARINEATVGHDWERSHSGK